MCNSYKTASLKPFNHVETDRQADSECVRIMTSKIGRAVTLIIWVFKKKGSKLREFLNGVSTVENNTSSSS